MTARLEGARALVKTFEAMQRRLSTSSLQRTLVRSAEPMRDAIAAAAPRGDEPPHIADHIGVTIARDDANVAKVRIGPTVGFHYGWYLEFGTSKMAAQPFMRPGFDTTTDDVTREAAPLVWETLTR